MIYHIDPDMDDEKEHECFAGMWSTTPPTEPGWYWTKTCRGAYLFNIEKSVGVLYFESVGMWWDEAMEEYKITHWLGPLPVPEMPE